MWWQSEYDKLGISTSISHLTIWPLLCVWNKHDCVGDYHLLQVVVESIKEKNYQPTSLRLTYVIKRKVDLPWLCVCIIHGKGTPGCSVFIPESGVRLLSTLLRSRLFRSSPGSLESCLPRLPPSSLVLICSFFPEAQSLFHLLPELKQNHWLELGPSTALDWLSPSLVPHPPLTRKLHFPLGPRTCILPSGDALRISLNRHICQSFSLDPP